MTLFAAKMQIAKRYIYIGVIIIQNEENDLESRIKIIETIIVPNECCYLV